MCVRSIAPFSTSHHLKSSILSGSTWTTAYNPCKMQIKHAGYGLLHGTVVLYVLSVLFGGAAWQPNNMYWAVIQALLSTVPLFVQLSTPSLEAVCRRLLSDGEAPPSSALPAGLSLLTSYFGGLVVPLDWGQPWQRWPKPGLVGASVGSLIGWLVVGARLLLQRKPKR